MKPTAQRRLPAATIAIVGTGALFTGVTQLSATAEVAPVPASLDAGADPEADASGSRHVLAETTTGGAALDLLDPQALARVASLNGLTVGEAEELLAADPSVRVAVDGHILFVEPAPDVGAVSVPGVGAAPVPLDPAEIPGNPADGSRPGARYTLHLDFDGATIENTQWNEERQEPALELAAAAAADADFQAAVWAYVAEDYAPFDVNVTTADPGAEALNRTSADDGEYGATVVITDTLLVPDAGAVAWLNGFGGRHLAPALVFAPNLANNAKYVADATTHEIGHTLGLGHDGIGDDEYYGATPPVPESLWGPIMGAAYTAPLTQWSQGDYAGASNAEDDLATITDTGFAGTAVTVFDGGVQWLGGWCSDAPENPQEGDVFVKVIDDECSEEELDAEISYLGRAAYARDDHGDDAGRATLLDNAAGEFTAQGVVGVTGEADVFELRTAGGVVSASAVPLVPGANLDIVLTLTDADGAEIVSDNPDAAVDPAGYPANPMATGVDASFTEDLPAGIYYLSVAGTGFGDPRAVTPGDGSGYTGYGSLGSYTVTGTAEPAPEPVDITSPADGATVAASDLEVSGTGEPGGRVALTVGGETVGEARAAVDRSWTGVLSADLAEGESTITATQAVDGVESTDTVTVNVAPVISPVFIRTPEEGDVVPGAGFEVAGTGEPGATITIAVDDGTNPVGEATVGEGGSWSTTSGGSFVPGEVEFMAIQRVGAVTTTDTVTVTVMPEAPLIDSPTVGEIVLVARPIMSGVSDPVAALTVQVTCGSHFATTVEAQANAFGRWGVRPEVDLPDGECTVTASQTVGGLTSPPSTVDFVVTSSGRAAE